MDNMATVSVAEPHGDQGGHVTPPPRPVKNSYIKDDCHAWRLIFHVSCPPLSEVSGSVIGITVYGDMGTILNLLGEIKVVGKQQLWV